MLGSQKDAGTGCCGDVQRERLVPLVRLAWGSRFLLGLFSSH